jgi:histone-lysine N-methyltransferase SETMAR
VVIEFLTAESSSPIEIHRRLRSVYVEDAIDVGSDAGSVVLSGEQDIGDMPCSGRPATAATTENKDKVDALIRDDRRITTSELCVAIWIGKPAVMAIIRELGYRKVCAKWVPKMLTVEHKTARKNICAELLQRSEKDGDAFFFVKNNYR